MVTLKKTELEERSAIVHSVNRGAFWKPCPGTTKGYLCCGYQILTPMTGCGMYCRYCILQTYFENHNQVVFDNFADLESEIRAKVPLHKGALRFGTGEFGDSLFSESQLQLSARIAALLAPFPNVLIEFKTKCGDIAPLRSIQHPEKVVIGFSLNTQRMIDEYEKGTASLNERLVAAAECGKMGFMLAFHFDPLFFYDGWEEEYRETVRAIFTFVKGPSRIAWCSLGAFRSMPLLKTYLRNRKAHLPLYSGEMIAGEDGKYRYFRPIRTAMFRAINEEFRKHDPRATVYLCMESPEVWRDAGMADRIPDGLVRYLDQRAKEILGIS
jgi:spore photoproduct lyase